VYWGTGTLVKRYSMSEQRGPAAGGVGPALQQIRDHPHGHLHAPLVPAHRDLARTTLAVVLIEVDFRAGLRLEPGAYSRPLFSST
jgi:hypothetical protein